MSYVSTSVRVGQCLTDDVVTRSDKDQILPDAVNIIELTQEQCGS